MKTAFPTHSYLLEFRHSYYSRHRINWKKLWEKSKTWHTFGSSNALLIIIANNCAATIKSRLRISSLRLQLEFWCFNHDRFRNILHAPSRLTSMVLDSQEPNVIFGGCYSGQICLWDIRINQRNPVCKVLDFYSDIYWFQLKILRFTLDVPIS